MGYAYDNLGRRAGITRGNGVTSAYGYDGIGRLTSLNHDVSGTDADVTFGYAYNPAGQIVTKTVSNNAYVYGPATGSTAYANNGLNQVTAVSGSGVGYDANGNIINDTTRAFTFDAANRLTGANGGTSTLSYDALGRLDVYVGTLGGRHIYAGAETVGFAPVGSTTLQNRFIRGPGVDEIVANYTTGTSPAQYWASDERGSLVNLSHGTSGANTIINTYDEYGVPAPNNLGRLQYTGQLWMPDFGAYHYKARAYQPELGRFLQADPIGYHAGTNLYSYVDADPINYTDPSGMCPMCVPFIAGFLVSAAIEGWSQYQQDGSISWTDAAQIGLQGGIGGLSAVFGGGVGAIAGRTLSSQVIAQGIGGAAGGGQGAGASSFASSGEKSIPAALVDAGRAARLGAGFGFLGAGALRIPQFEKPFSRIEQGFRPIVQWGGRRSASVGSIFGEGFSTGIGAIPDIRRNWDRRPRTLPDVLCTFRRVDGDVIVRICNRS